MKNLCALIVGFIFAFGLGISGMLDPSNVYAFLDVYGIWKPNLAFVMVGAIPVYFAANTIAKLLPKPAFERDFSHLPKPGWNLSLKAKVGSLFFGIGWGLSGLCPGPAIASLVTLSTPLLVFTCSMIAGFVFFGKNSAFLK